MTMQELERHEINRILRTEGDGVLSLTNGTETYGVPVGFGYDGETVYFQFISTNDSRKMKFIETTEIGTLTVYTSHPCESVIVRGPVDPVSESEEMQAANVLIDNANTPMMNVRSDGSLEDTIVEFYRISMEEVSGKAWNGAASSDRR